MMENKHKSFDFKTVLNFLDKIETNSSTMDYYLKIVDYYNNYAINNDSFKVLLKII